MRQTRVFTVPIDGVGFWDTYPYMPKYSNDPGVIAMQNAIYDWDNNTVTASFFAEEEILDSIEAEPDVVRVEE